jgi:hypothetical protein
MATDKKGFVLYADLIHTVSKMPDDKAGELLKHILSYVNDENPETDDLIIQLTFEPIKQQLKRDLIKYKDKKESLSLSGRIGNLKRWNLDLYQDYKKEIYTLRGAESIAEGRKLSPPDDSLSPPIANIAVTDTVSVTVKDTVTVKDSKETIKGIYEFFNLERKDLPEAIKLNDSRKKLIKCRLEEYDQDTIKKVILKARDNNFLSGKETNFKANFDWIFNKTNFLKILEGNYENEKTNFGKDKPAFKLKTNRPT